MNRWQCVLAAIMCSSIVSCSSQQIPAVQQLSLRDPRLSLEARRWLADTEDEVVIARAGVELAAARVERITEYKKTLKDEAIFLPDAANKANVGQMQQALYEYVEAQLALEEAQLLAAQKALELAQARLTQVEAETAIRYDMAVYPMEPIVRQVEDLKLEVAQTQSILEDLRVSVETRAGAMWREYASFVKQGGITRDFWKHRSL